MNSRDQQSLINFHMYEATSKHIHTYLIFLIITSKSRCTFSNYQLYFITFLLVSYRHTTHQYWNQKMKVWMIPWKLFSFWSISFWQRILLSQISQETHILSSSLGPHYKYELCTFTSTHMIVHITWHDICISYNIAWDTNFYNQ